jgi:AcrR family transcriptional regulator
MMNKPPASVRKRAASAPSPHAKIDRRVERTTRALGAALVALMLEQPFDRITVQDILDRAGVGRSTFYAHFRNKHDVLFTDYERVLGVMERALDHDFAGEQRVAPVKELFSHVREAHQLVDALRASGQLERMWDEGVAHFARMIERRIVLTSADANGDAMPRALASRVLAGALIEMLKWWLDRDPGFSPEQMDRMFHDLVRNTLRGSGRVRFQSRT